MLLATSLATAQGQSRPQGRRQTNWWADPNIQQELVLTNEQVDEIADIYQSTSQARQDASTEHRAAYQALVTAMGDDSTSDEELAALRQELEDASLASTRATIDLWTQLRGVLSAKQWSMLPETASSALRMSGVWTRGSGRSRSGGSRSNRSNRDNN